MLPQERFSWVWLTALVVVLGAYFSVVTLMHYVHPEPSFLLRIGVLAIALGTLAVIAIAAKLYGYWRDRGEEVGMDERDRAIELRASRIAYFVLLAGCIYAGMVLPFTQGGWEVVHAALVAIAVAEIVHSSMIAMAYRRDRHA